MKLIKYLLTACFLVFLAGCGMDGFQGRHTDNHSAEQKGHNDDDGGGTGACPEHYSPLCGQPPMPECPPGMGCPTVMPSPKTYDNNCKMQKAGADLIHHGECDNSHQSGVCPEIYAPVCGQPPMPECPPGLACPTVMPSPQTYSNDCHMQDAGAEFIHDGECEDGY